MVEKIKIKKTFIFFAITLMLTVGVVAFYAFSYDKDVTYEIVGSKKDLVILLDLTDQILNVSENLSSTQNLTLENQNGATTMQYFETLNVTNLDPGNCTITGDISFELFKDGIGIISNLDNFTMNAGVNDFNYTVIAINNRVCPQNITASLMFTEN